MAAVAAAINYVFMWWYVRVSSPVCASQCAFVCGARQCFGQSKSEKNEMKCAKTTGSVGSSGPKLIWYKNRFRQTFKVHHLWFSTGSHQLLIYLPRIIYCKLWGKMKCLVRIWSIEFHFSSNLVVTVLRVCVCLFVCDRVHSSQMQIHCHQS